MRGFFESSFLLLIISFIILPIFALIVFSFFDPSGNFTFKYFEKILFSESSSLLGTTPLLSIFYSILIAIIASVISTFAGLMASFRKSKFSFVEIFMNSAIAISLITLAFGYMLGFGSGNLLVIAIGHSILAFPFAFRVISNAMNKIDSESIDTARTLGADYLQVFKKIQFPRIKSALLVAVVFSFAVSLGELGFVLVLYDGIYATMPVYIYRLITTFDIYAASAMGVILISISFLCFYAIEKLSKNVQVF